MYRVDTNGSKLSYFTSFYSLTYRIIRTHWCRTSGLLLIVYCYKVKGTAVPLQARSGPEGSWKLRFPDFMTTAQDGGKVVSLTQDSNEGRDTNHIPSRYKIALMPVSY